MPTRGRPARHRRASPAAPATDGGVGVADPPAERRRHAARDAWTGGRGGRRGGPGAPEPRRRGARALRWLGGADGRAVTVLVLLPLGFFCVPALVGHPAITGDNLIQNFPLRVLTGRQLRQGHLPLWNPYVWSGSPLLGGLNAGSFYPLTLLFALLAPVAAWVANLLAVYWAGGLSMYALCRQFRLRPLPGALAAITFAFSGTMSGQFVHLGVVEGMAWTPLVVLAMLRLSWSVLGTEPAGVDDGRAATGRAARAAAPAGGSPWPWVALLGAAVGLEALTGEPRAMAETEVVGAVVVAWLVLRPYPRARRPVGASRRVRLFAYAALGAAWGVALAAAELAPGWTFIRASQRAVESYQFFGSGSLRPAWSLLLLVPDLFGGVGHFGQQRWFNSYNLPEVTGYVGLLPLGAALALLTRSFGRRRSAASSDWGLFLALGALGLLLAWGSFTPLGHVWAAIPLFGKTRLQSRNLEIVDFALAVLLAFFLDRLLSDRPERATVRPAASDLDGWRRYVAVAPALAAVLVCVLALAAPSPVEQWLHASARGAPLASRLWPWFLAEIGVAAAVVALVWGWRRLGVPARRVALAAVLLADLGLFVAATSTAVAPPNATTEPVRAAATAVVGSSGRFAIVDTSVSRLLTLTAVGQPDLNAFTRVPSVQGYGSIVSGTYGDATGTHFLDTLSGCALARGAFAPLRLSTLVVFPGNLVSVVGATPAEGGPTSAPSPVPHVPTAVPATPASCPGAPVAGTGTGRVLYLGWPVRLVSATVVVQGAPAAPRARRLVVSVLGARGAASRPAETVRATATGWHVTFARPQRATGIVVRDGGAAVSLATTVTSASGTSWAFEGTLQSALDLPAWRLRGTFDGTFGVFASVRPVRPPVWLAHGAAGSAVRQVRATDWGTTVDRVDAAAPVTVVSSESYAAGWRAELQPLSAGRPDGAARSVTVERDGLLQSVRVPRGTWLLTFTYRPRTLDLGLAGSCLALAAFAVLGAVALVRRRRPPGRARQGAGAPVA